MSEHGRWIVKGKPEDQNVKDLMDTKARSLASIGGTNWATGAPKKGEVIPENKQALTTNKISPKTKRDRA